MTRGEGTRRAHSPSPATPGDGVVLPRVRAPRRPVTPSLTEVINMKYALLVALAALVALPASATGCHRNKYIVGIAGNIDAKGKTGIYVADTVHGLPNPTTPIEFVESDTEASAKILYSIAQNAINLHQRIYRMECDKNGHIYSLQVVRSRD